MRLSRDYPDPHFSLPRHRFALLTALATLALVGVGGLVTSHGVGMAVPDWPNTYGYSMFYFPFSRWVGGVFYEHSHRLVASAVGLMTTICAVWLFGRPARRFLRWLGVALVVLGAGTMLGARAHSADGSVALVAGLAACCGSFFWPRCEPAPKWLRRLGVAAFLAVVLQGVLGGLRVVLLKDQIGILHAALAQLFFVLTCALAWFTRPRSASIPVRSRPRGREDTGNIPGNSEFRESLRTGMSARGALGFFLCLTTVLIFAQLIIGATMRHQHAGLSIPDFPLAYGKLWPATDAPSVAHYNQQRLEVLAANPITAFQVVLQMAHRLVALGILFAVAASAWLARRDLGAKHTLSRLALAWLGLVMLQALLGAATIWSDKAADIATAHVMVGALSLAFGSLLNVVCLEGACVPLAATRFAVSPDAPGLLGPAATPLPGKA